MARVLLVDDNWATLLSNAKLLMREGHQVIEAESGLEALQLYLAGKPDVVVTELNLLERDGIWLIGEIRKTDVSTPIVMMAGRDNFSKQVSLANAKGVSVCLSKPVIPSRLIGAVHGLMQRKALKL